MNYIVRHNGLIVFISSIKENYEVKKRLYADMPGYDFMELTDEEYDAMFPVED